MLRLAFSTCLLVALLAAGFFLTIGHMLSALFIPQARKPLRA